MTDRIPAAGTRDRSAVTDALLGTRAGAATRWGVAVGVSALALALTAVFDRVMATYPMTPLMAAVVASAVFGGLWPGLLTALLCALGTSYFLVAPRLSFRVDAATDLVRLALFVAMALIVSALSDRLRAARARAAALAATLEERNAALAEQAEQLTAQAAELEMTNAQLVEQQAELEMSNQQLQEQQAELEAQQIELEAQQVALEEQAVDLDAARRTAEAANAAKGTFLANMSHELRTPLNAIQGHVQLLEMGIHGPVTEAQLGALGRVQGAQRHLLGLINDVLNYAKLEAGRVEYALDEVDLRDALAAVAPLVEPQWLAKGLHWKVHVPGEPLLVWADADKLRQVLVNLCSNAVKFTPDGGCVALQVAHPADAPRLVHVEVIDTGVGIPADRLEAIFAPFVQVRARDARASEGTGLGLTISRELARGMGGDLTVESEVGTGSTFRLALRRVVTADGARTDRRFRDERRAEGERRDGARRAADEGVGDGYVAGA